jgi:hypothetical protein
MTAHSIPRPARPADTSPDISAPSGHGKVGRPTPAARAPWKAVALPAEHGGWGLTIEPALLGLLVAPSLPGVALAFAALVAFLSRTPLKLAVIDHRRGRRLERTRLAGRIAAGEIALLAVLTIVAALTADPRFWLVVLAAAPLVGLELWFDVRSRGRRLVPELAGSAGISAVAAAIVLADGGSAGLAVGLWLIAAGRAIASVPYARSQVAQLHKRPRKLWVSDLSQVVAVAIAVVAAVLDRKLAVGLAAVAIVAAYHLAAVRRPSPKPAILGSVQMTIGFSVVLITWLGAVAPW